MLELGYIALSLAMVVILYLIGNHAITQSTPDLQQRSKHKRNLILGLLGWQAYIFALGSSGILLDLSFPPRFALLMILPAFLFTGIFLARNRKSRWIQSIPPLWLTAYQSFRIIVETLFVFTVAAGFLHPNVTIEGYNFDMIFGFTAPLIAFLVFRSQMLPKRLLQAWNYLGLAVLASVIFLFMTTIYFPELYGPETAPFPNNFGSYPYVLVAGFLMPSAVFVHVLSLVQLAHRVVDEPKVEVGQLQKNL